MLSKLVSGLRLSTAATTWLGALAVAAQVVLSYIPDHNDPWYNGVQGLIGLLSLLGIHAANNTVVAARTAVTDATTVVHDVAKDMQGGPVAIPVNVPEPAPLPAPPVAPTPADPATHQ